MAKKTGDGGPEMIGRPRTAAAVAAGILLGLAPLPVLPLFLPDHPLLAWLPVQPGTGPLLAASVALLLAAAGPAARALSPARLVLDRGGVTFRRAFCSADRISWDEAESFELLRTDDGPRVIYTDAPTGDGEKARRTWHLVPDASDVMGAARLCDLLNERLARSRGGHRAPEGNPTRSASSYRRSLGGGFGHGNHAPAERRGVVLPDRRAKA